MTRNTIENSRFMFLKVQLVQNNGCLLLPKDNTLRIVPLIVITIVVTIIIVIVVILVADS
jgi:hypothetical protein